MRNAMLRAGSTGPLVRDLQTRLNRRLNPSPRLTVNGYFSAQTELALRMFQQSLWLEPSGCADMATVDALYDTEVMVPILHNLPYVAEPAGALCWAAATAMLTHSAVQQVRRTTPAAMQAENGGLIEATGREDRQMLHAAFARAHKLVYHPPQVWSVAALLEFLRTGPVMIEFRQPIHTHRRRASNWAHILFVGLRGSHEVDGRTTTLRIFDPDGSQGRGQQSLLYAHLQRQMGFANFGIFTP